LKDKPTVILFCQGSFGDIIHFSHLAKFIKPRIPNCTIYFAVNDKLQYQFNNGIDDPTNEILDIIELQEGIDHVGVFTSLNTIKNEKGNILNDTIILRNGDKITECSKIYEQCDFYTDSTYLDSLYIEYINDFGYHPMLKETKFNVGTKKKLSKEYIDIAIPGYGDWNNKWKNKDKEKQSLLNYIKKTVTNSRIVVIGPENGNSYLKNLQLLNNCRLFLGPHGSLAISAVGLQVDTITIGDIVPPTWDNPQYYHSGFHKAIVCRSVDHCGSYKCMEKGRRYLTQTKCNPSFAGPPWIEFGSPWIEKCPYTDSGLSCVNMTRVEDIIDAFNRWLQVRFIKGEDGRNV